MNGIEPAPTGLDPDLPLKQDIRLLGQLLGDTLREQEGENLRAHRAHPADGDPLPPRRRTEARAELETAAATC